MLVDLLIFYFIWHHFCIVALKGSYFIFTFLIYQDLI